MWLEVGGGVLLVLQAVTIGLLWQHGRRLAHGVSNKAHNAGGASELMIVNALSKIDHRLSELEKRGQRIEADTSRRSVEVPAVQMAAMRSASLHSSASNYELAQQLAREGCDLEQLIARCGLSRNEAELVLRLYAKRA